MLGGAVNAIMPFMNTFYLSRLGVAELAAGGLALSIFVFMMVLFWGIFSTMGAFIARHQGAEEVEKIGLLVRTALVVAFLMSLPIIGAFHLVGIILSTMGYPANLVVDVNDFFNTMSFAVPADLLLSTLYAFCFGLSRPRYVMILTLFQVPINLFLNYVFIFGKWGAPKFVVAGIGVGVACTYWMLLAVLVLVLSYQKMFRIHLWGSRKLDLNAFWELFKVGGPAGMQWVLEMGFFSIVALMMGRMNLNALAAYQVAYQIYSLFMSFVYNFNQATTIRVADGLGAKVFKQVKYSYASSYVFIAFVMVIILCLVTFLRGPLIHLFAGGSVEDPTEFLNFCYRFLLIMPLFALLDFLGYTQFEVLRAFKDTRFPMMVVFIVYWVIMLPIMYSAITIWQLNNPYYLWGFLITGSALSFIGQGLRFRYQFLGFKKEAMISRSS